VLRALLDTTARLVQRVVDRLLGRSNRRFW
jgi:hypothetical protein